VVGRRRIVDRRAGDLALRSTGRVMPGDEVRSSELRGEARGGAENGHAARKPLHRAVDTPASPEGEEQEAERQKPPAAAVPEGALDETVAEMEVEEDLRVLDDGGDRFGGGEAPLSMGPASPDAGRRGATGEAGGASEPWTFELEGGYDPEAGIMRVADKRFSLRRLAPPGSLGQLILSLVLFLIAVNLGIVAVILRDPVYVYTAPVVTPVGLFYSIRMFRRWKGHRALTIRIEETLEGTAER